MNKLRKLIEAVNNIVDVTYLYPDIAKKDPDLYLSVIENLQNDVNSYIDEASEEFKKWCDKSIEVWDMNQTNLFSSMKRFIKMAYVNHFLNKISKNLYDAGLLRKNLRISKERLTQFKYFITAY